MRHLIDTYLSGQTKSIFASGERGVQRECLARHLGEK